MTKLSSSQNLHLKPNGPLLMPLQFPQFCKPGGSYFQIASFITLRHTTSSIPQIPTAITSRIASCTALRFYSFFSFANPAYMDRCPTESNFTVT